MRLLQSIKSNDFLTRWSSEIMWKTTYYISNTKAPIVTKAGRMVTYHKELPPIESYYPLITWYFKIITQTKTIISPQSQFLLLLNLVGWWFILRGSYPQKFHGFETKIENILSSLPHYLLPPKLSWWWRTLWCSYL